MIELKLRPRLVPLHGVEDGINAARRTLPRCWFDAKRCEGGIERLRQYKAAWDDAKKCFSDRPLHDWTSHTADAFRYLCMSWREVSSEPRQPTAAERRAAEHATVAALIAPRTYDDMLGEDRDDD